jgi:hypothetical protein
MVGSSPDQQTDAPDEFRAQPIEAIARRLAVTSEPSLRANGSRECAPDDRLREAIHGATKQVSIASSAALLAMTSNKKPAVICDGRLFSGTHKVLQPLLGRDAYQT